MIFEPKNMGLDTIFVQASAILPEITWAIAFLVMAPHICMKLICRTFGRLVNTIPISSNSSTSLWLHLLIWTLVNLRSFQHLLERLGNVTKVWLPWIDAYQGWRILRWSDMCRWIPCSGRRPICIVWWTAWRGCRWTSRCSGAGADRSKFLSPATAPTDRRRTLYNRTDNCKTLKNAYRLYIYGVPKSPRVSQSHQGFLRSNIYFIKGKLRKWSQIVINYNKRCYSDVLHFRLRKDGLLRQHVP